MTAANSSECKRIYRQSLQSQPRFVHCVDVNRYSFAIRSIIFATERHYFGEMDDLNALTEDELDAKIREIIESCESILKLMGTYVAIDF